MRTDRLETVRRRIDGLLHRLADPWARRCAFVHMYGVSATAVLLAARRGLDRELAAVAGMLHDLSSYTTGDPQDHAADSSRLAQELLDEIGGFSAREIALICTAIARHSTKEAVHTPFDELLKDADILQHELYKALPPEVSPARLRVVAREFGLGPPSP